MFAPRHPTLPRRLLAGMVLLCLGASPGFGQLVEWAAALASGSSESSFVAVEATIDEGSGNPAALCAGNFTGNLNFGPGPALSNSSGQDGVVARLDDDPALPWEVTWKLQVPSSGNVDITDLVVGPNEYFYICGTYGENATFGTTTLSTPGGSSGFVAWGDASAASPVWEGAFKVPDMAPASIAVKGGAGINIFVTGPGPFPGDLARKYDQGGNALWTLPEPLPDPDTTPTDIVIDPRPGAQAVYVLAEDPGYSGNEDIVLYQLDDATGTPMWTRRMGSPGNDYAGGLAVPADGAPRVSFCSTVASGVMTYDTLSLPGIPALAGRHGVILRVRENGALVWSCPLGTLTTPGGEITPTDLSVDDVGNAYVSAKFSGTYVVEGVNETGIFDAVVAGVDATGTFFEFKRSSNTSTENPKALATPTRGLIVEVGDYLGTASWFGSILLPAAPTAGQPQGFISIATPPPGQELQILVPDAGTTVADLRNAVNDAEVDGQVYETLFLDSQPYAIAAWITPDQLGALGSLPGLSFTPELDAPFATNGTTSSAGWALGHLNTVPTTASSYSFTYPDNTETVFVYLIDTAVGSADGGEQGALDTWFGGNSNLTVLPTTLIRGSGDPTTSSVFVHGTQMLSLIGGPTTGAAVGVPVVVKNFDFYPNGSSTTSTLLADAIDAAMTWHDTGAGCSPGVIVIASGSTTPGSSSTITAYLEYARDTYGLASIIPAGNESDDTANYTPAENGSEAGIICAAGSDETEFATSTTNTGSEVDLYAPGFDVRVVDYDDPNGGGHDSFNGTSASAALTGAVAAIHLSMNPWLSPEDLETEITGDTSNVGPGPTIDVLQVAATGPTFTGDYDMWAEFHELSTIAHTADDDGDGWLNLEEYFYGLDPCGPDLLVEPLEISYNHGTGDYTLDFALNAVLADASSPNTLRDGSALDLTSSTDLMAFGSLGATPTVGPTSNGRTAMSHTDSATTKCFYRLEITPSTPSP